MVAIFFKLYIKVKRQRTKTVIHQKTAMKEKAHTAHLVKLFLPKHTKSFNKTEKNMTVWFLRCRKHGQSQEDGIFCACNALHRQSWACKVQESEKATSNHNCKGQQQWDYSSTQFKAPYQKFAQILRWNDKNCDKESHFKLAVSTLKWLNHD